MGPQGAYIGVLFTLNKVKTGQKYFSSILQKVFSGFTWNLLSSLLELILEVFKIWTLRDHILSILQNVSNGFTWNLFLNVTGNALRSVWNMAPRSHVKDPLSLWIGTKLGQSHVLVYFVIKCSTMITSNCFLSLLTSNWKKIQVLLYFAKSIQWIHTKPVFIMLIATTCGSV